MPNPVHLLHVSGYERDPIRRAAAELLQAAGFRPAAGDRVLVKPNLIAPKAAGLACTHGEVVRAACEFVLDHGAKPMVGDSPAFGTGKDVADRVGIAEAIADLDAPFVNLNRPAPLALSFGPTVGVSRAALECDHILNVPKLKAHVQVRMTGAVKNYFGCVTGVRKPLAHTRFGDKANKFEAMIVDVMQAMPAGASLMDGVVAMHEEGPTTGEPFPLGLLGACTNPVALDTAIYSMFCLRPADVPVWLECQNRGLPGSLPEDLVFPLLSPGDFDTAGFRIPAQLMPMTFNPVRLIRGGVKRILTRFFC
jgi:uncharacterized protein (DUF362 family)